MKLLKKTRGIQKHKNNILTGLLFLASVFMISYLSRPQTHRYISTVSLEKIAVFSDETPLQKNDNTLKNVLFSKEVLTRIFWVALLLFVFFYYLKKMEQSIFEDNSKISFFFINMALMVGVITLIITFIPNYLYAVPFVILPILIRVFWNTSLALVTQTTTLLLLVFTIPNYIEFFTLQIIAGIIAILSAGNLYKRNIIFKTIAKVTLSYSIIYTVFHFGNMSFAGLDIFHFGLFILSGILTFFVYFLIWVYENFFGLLSQISLLELSNTNASLLKELNEKAPGTFQHSMQVATLAEKVARELDADAMLTKVGALYHDIGKIENPYYFIENQRVGINLHDEISPLESAEIIINHVILGIEKAKEKGIPEQIIDFIRTHHGTNLVYYFYKKQCKIAPMDENFFRYKGLLPFSKETVILMMCDSVEAACRSISKPTEKGIKEMVESVIERQIQQKQYINAPITFSEINRAKKVLIDKTKSMYHMRVTYP